MGAMVALTAVLTGLQQANLLRGRIISSTLSSARFLRHLLRLPVTFFAQRSPADLVQRLQSNDAVAETLARDLAAAGVDAVVVARSTRSCCGRTTRSSPSSAWGSRCSTWSRCAS